MTALPALVLFRLRPGHTLEPVAPGYAETSDLCPAPLDVKKRQFLDALEGFVQFRLEISDVDGVFAQQPRTVSRVGRAVGPDVVLAVALGLLAQIRAHVIRLRLARRVEGHLRGGLVIVAEDEATGPAADFVGLSADE